jgi:hypothetical protein
MLFFLFIDCKIFIVKCEYFANSAQPCGSCTRMIFTVNTILVYSTCFLQNGYFFDSPDAGFINFCTFDVTVP